MGRLRHWVRRLEYASRQEGFSIPMSDGSVREFTRRQMVEGYLALYEAVINGTEVDHPVLEAMKNSSDPHWRGCFADLLDDPPNEPAKDLSVQSK